MLDNQLGEADSENGQSTRQRFGGPYRHFPRRRPTVYHASARSLSRAQSIFLRYRARLIAEKRHRRALLMWLKRQKRVLQERHEEQQQQRRQRRQRSLQAEDEADAGDDNSDENQNETVVEQDEEHDENDNGSNSGDEEEFVNYESEIQALDNAMIEVQRPGKGSKYSVPERAAQGTMDSETWTVRPDGYTDMGDQSVFERRQWQGADDFLMRRRKPADKRTESIPILNSATLGLPDESLLKSLNVYGMELLGGAVAAERYEGKFDETALLALGIVVEEHIGEMLGPTGHRVYAEYAQSSGDEAAVEKAEKTDLSENENDDTQPKAEVQRETPLMFDGRRSREAKRMDFLRYLKTDEEEQAAADAVDEDSGDESGNYLTEQESEPDDVDAVDVNHSFNLSGQKYKPAAARRRPLGAVDYDHLRLSMVKHWQSVSRDVLDNLL